MHILDRPPSGPATGRRGLPLTVGSGMLAGRPRSPYVSDLAHERQILTPGQLNALARDLLEGAFPLVWVEGEISNLSRPASGHLYFSLKDERAQVRCALFRNKALLLRFRPADGQRVLARGRLTLYEPRGDCQLVLDHMEEAGEGALRRAFEELKARLAAEGLFDAARKRPLPRFVRRLGILTSPHGAAVRDVLSVLGRRFPLIEAEILPVPVQGTSAAAEIAAMLRRAYASGRHDALLLTRGGGSLEDLWCFNDEALARLIVESPVPLVSAVGHEIDVTLADFAADLRAPTPSAAAELLAPDRGELLAALAAQRRRLDSAFARLHRGLAQRADRAWLRLRAVSPQQRVARSRQRLGDLDHRLRLVARHLIERSEGRLAAAAARLRLIARRLIERSQGRLATAAARLRAVHPRRRLQDSRERLRRLRERQQFLLARRLEQQALRLAGLARALEATSPLATLARGYVILRDRDSGALLRLAGEATPGRRVRAQFADGQRHLTVDDRQDD